ISEVGSYQELMRNDGKFSEFVHEHSESAKKERNQEQEVVPPRKATLRSESITSAGSSIRSRTSTLTSLTELDSQQLDPDDPKSQQQLIQTEHAETGRVKLSNYLTYFKSYTYFWFSMILVGYVAKQ